MVNFERIEENINLGGYFEICYLGLIYKKIANLYENLELS